MTTVDTLIDDCASEPIHIPGLIQPHGLLLTLSEPALEVLQASSNLSGALGLDAQRLSGQALASVLGSEAAVQVSRALADLDAFEEDVHQLTLDGYAYDILLHRHQGLLFLELERSLTLEHSAVKQLSRTLRRLQSA